MSEWKLLYSQRFLFELRAIHSYITDTLLAPDAAENQIKRIMKNVKELVDMPHKFSLYDKEPWHSRGLRKVVIDNYLVFYFTNDDKKEVVLFDVFYGGRNIPKILSFDLNKNNDEAQ